MRRKTNYGDKFYDSDFDDEEFNYGYQSLGTSQESSKFDKRIHSPSANSGGNSFQSSPSSSSSSSDPRIGTMKSNYYEQRKREMNNEGGEGESWLVRIIKQMVAYLKSFYAEDENKNGSGGGKNEGKKGVRKLEMDYEEEHRASVMKSYISIKYDTKNKKHVKRLMDFWKVCFPRDRKLPGVINTEWKKLGFQNKNPASDFRAAGIFGLECVLYYSQIYPSLFKKQIRYCLTENTAYPFILAAFNTLMMLMTIGGMSHKDVTSNNYQGRKKFVKLIFGEDAIFSNIKFPAIGKKRMKKKLIEKEKIEETKVGTLLDFGEDLKIENEGRLMKDENPKQMKKVIEESFEEESSSENIPTPLKALMELFCCSFWVMHNVWIDNHGSYFKFPEILEKTEEKVLSFLDLDFSCLEDIILHNKKQKKIKTITKI